MSNRTRPVTRSPGNLHLAAKLGGAKSRTLVDVADRIRDTNEGKIMENQIRRDLIGGARAMAPWLLGVVPFGMLIGVSAAQASIPTAAGWLTGPTIYGGSAQIAAIQMLDAGAAPVAVIVTVLVISLRFVLYSAALAPYWRNTPLWWRLLGGYLLVDPSFVVGIER